MEEDSLHNKIKKEADNLKSKGELDGLHNLVRQNVSLDKRNIELIKAINKLEKSTTYFSRILIFIAFITVLVTLFPKESRDLLIRLFNCRLLKK